MIPNGDEYLSFLMGASAISSDDLRVLGIEILKSVGSNIRKLLIPESAFDAYRTVIHRELQPDYWNEVVGRTTVTFMFKLNDGTVRELKYSPESREEISRLCSKMNSDPIEKTDNVLRYLATNSFYRDTMVECYGVTLE